VSAITLRTSAKNVNVFLVFLLKKFVRAVVLFPQFRPSVHGRIYFFLLLEKIVHSFLFKDMYFKVIQ
jgi:hypothetical protein